MLEWDVFVSHASEDKAAVASPLADLLQRGGLRVWLDEQQLEVGDSLRSKIDRGLAQSRFGAVVLSPRFFAKLWPTKELDGLVARERAGYKVILPIWHEISQDEVAQFSPLLAGVVAVKTESGLDVVAQQITKAVLRSGSGAPSSTTPTIALKLTELLRSGDCAALADFFRFHQQLVLPFGPSHGSSKRTSVSGPLNLGGAVVDVALSSFMHSVQRWRADLLIFTPQNTAIFSSEGRLSLPVRQALDAFERARHWVAGNLVEARRVLPGITPGFTGIILASRRHLFHAGDHDRLAELNDQLTGTTVRTYDYAVDIAAQLRDM